MNKKYVFVDWNDIDPGYGIDKPGYEPQDAAPYGVEIVAHAPKVDLNPLVIGDTPWETSRAGMYATIIKIGDEYRMWYDGIGPRIKLCYATSKDGIHWEKPNLGLNSFQGSTDNNIIFNNAVGGIIDEGWVVLYEEDAPEDERFKMVFTRVSLKGDSVDSVWIMGALSSDGIHWRETGRIFEGGDTQSTLVYNEIRKKYQIFTKARDIEHAHRRIMMMLETEDFKICSEPHYIMNGSPNDAPDTDCYTPAYHRWKGTDNAHIMFPSIFHRTQDYIELKLAVSRDLVTWNMAGNGKTMVGIEQTGRRTHYADVGMTEDGEGHWVHYFAMGKQGHHTASLGGDPLTGIYRMIFREDGYTSLHSESHGSVTTIVLPHSKGLKVNAEIGYKGYVKIAVTDRVSNEPLPGFGFDDCVLEQIDNVSYRVRWGKELSEIPDDKEYRLKFNLFRADIYSYTLEDVICLDKVDADSPYIVGADKGMRA